MPPALTHDRCRQEMCAACGGRAGSRPVSPGLGIMIRKWASEVPSYPTGICKYCRAASFSSSARAGQHRAAGPALDTTEGKEVHEVQKEQEAKEIKELQ